jgi:hypothetical protein
MSFVFRGTRADLEGGLSGFMPERRSMVWFSSNSASPPFSIYLFHFIFMMLAGEFRAFWKFW